MSSPPTPLRVRARMLVRLFNGDVTAAAEIRSRMVGREMRRRDEHGVVIVENRFDGDRGNPPPVEPQPPQGSGGP